MFVLTFADGSEHRDVRLVRLHALLSARLQALGFTRGVSLQDCYQLSARTGFKSKRLTDWAPVFTITKTPHTKVVEYRT